MPTTRSILADDFAFVVTALTGYGTAAARRADQLRSDAMHAPALRGMREVMLNEAAQWEKLEADGRAAIARMVDLRLTA